MRTGKYLFLAWILIVFISSCDVDNDESGIAYGYIQAYGANVVGEIKHTGEETIIAVKYRLTNSCQNFLQLQTLKNEDGMMEIAVLGSVKQSKECVSISEEQSREFPFKPIFPGEYTFRFWNGQGKYTYLTLSITDP